MSWPNSSGRLQAVVLKFFSALIFCLKELKQSHCLKGSEIIVVVDEWCCDLILAATASPFATFGSPEPTSPLMPGR